MLLKVTGIIGKNVSHSHPPSPSLIPSASAPGYHGYVPVYFSGSHGHAPGYHSNTPDMVTRLVTMVTYQVAMVTHLVTTVSRSATIQSFKTSRHR